MSGADILIVDDELIMRESLAGWIERDGHRTETAESGEEALEKLGSRRFDIALVDIKMEGISGLDVLRHIKESDLDTAVIMITAYGSVSTAINAMKNGACDYLLKPFDPNELGIVIEKIIESRDRIRENLYLREERRERTRFESMIGQSEKMTRVFDLIKDVAPMSATVLITGETGTGKGLAAKAIHASGHLSSGPFVGVNCGAIPENLMESEIFGHQKGAFTDAAETRKGRLELAHGGTLFLDEIGEISMRMQIDLLRAIEDKVFYRVGGAQPIEVDFRVIAATNRNIEEAVKSGAFREDLYYRLNVISFEMPPLRERKEDIPLLAESFLRRFSQETNKPVSGISRQTLDEMMLYEWPGNVRELENAVERAVVIGKGAMIMPGDLPIFRREDCLPAESVRLKDVEKEHIVKILSENSGNITRSAKILGIDRSTLHKKIKRYHIAGPNQN
ncbi:Transcriptional regulatory protein ZraR [Candidatus Desulfarcum epimagneticum]|uniref:Transcriptional regulatory protein ZraR n=1 Tax=uncultured Desulfobacteraceae bacterium TaxID=218296 RepID=A0A484HIQ3_9BACT|nr:Transcriptional regulatory protein ZraR [uncultured Desulfobacteraceae bacterium]